jgi:hypothetical protein
LDLINQRTGVEQLVYVIFGIRGCQMRITILLLIAFLLIELITIGQKPHEYVNYNQNKAIITNRLRHADTVHNNFFKLDVTRLLAIEIFVTYERKFTKWLSFETGLGYQFSDGGNFKINDIGGMSYYLVFPYKGVIVTIGPKLYHFIPRMPNIYIQPLFLYRNLWYDNLWAQELKNSDMYAFEDRDKIDYGASLNFGVMKKYNALIVDFCVGFGVRKSKIKETVYQSAPYWDHRRVYTYDPPEVYYIYKVNPVINISLKLGFGF